MVGSCLFRKSDLAASLEYGQKTLELSTRIGDKAAEAEALLGANRG